MYKILIIEDDYYVRLGLKELLVQSKYDVLALEGAEELKKHLRAFKPDLVVCDIMMKNISGYEVLEKLRADGSTIPFIFLTAKCELTDIRKGMNLGADDYIVKPYRAKDLLKAIQYRIEKQKQIIKDFEEKKNLIDKKEELYSDSVIVNHNGVPKHLKHDQIVYIEADSEYTKVYLSNSKKLYIRKLLKSWEDTLPASKFLRIHRSTIVNLSFIKSTEKTLTKSLKISLKNLDQNLIVSQRYASKIKSLLTF